MAAPVLATKLFVPPLRPDLVFRQRLINQLNAGLQRKLTIVSAPTGYGKTTLISSWLHETKISSAWLSLDEDDNDPIRFFQYFISALQRIIPTLGGDLVGPLQGRLSFDTSINLLINEIAEHADPFAVVLDDFHLIDSQVVLDIITFLVERMPPQMHLVLLSRTDPPFPLARLRARNQLVEIRAEQLRFTLDEIAVFLNEIMRLELSASDLAAMEARTEGWIASLQLAALSMQGSKDAHAFVTAFAGSHHYIMDYLVEEVLNSQTERIRLFLLQTSILDRMCAPLCNALVDIKEREGVDG
jgi:LuxR family maltose regulon positive regulatory protein